MNLSQVKRDIKSHVNCAVEVKVYGTRNRVETIKGFINNAYPNIFTVLEKGENKSFRYADIITGEIKIKYM